METKLSRAGTNKRGFLRRMLPRSERLPASIGVMAGALVFCSTLGSAGWGVYTAWSTRVQAAKEQVHSVAGGIARSAELRLASGAGIGDLRAEMTDVVARNGLEVCRLMLPDGRVIADASESRQAAVFGPDKPLPEQWSSGPGPEATGELAGAERIEIEVPGRGEALLFVRGNATNASLTWEQRAGIGAVAAASMGGLLLTYRWMRGRLRTVSALGDALRLAQNGQAATSELLLAPDLGPEATAWNRLLAERDQLREQALVRKAGEQMSVRSAVGGELATACDGLWQGLVLVDAEGKVVYANGAAAAFLGAAREELTGAELAGLVEDEKVRQAIRDATTGKLRPRVSIEVKAAPAEMQPAPADAKLKIAGVERRGAKPRARGAGVLRYSIRPVRRDDQAAALVLIEDVTQQRVADESRNAFVAHATHELRTPLTNIRLYVEKMIDEGTEDTRVREQCINVIGQEARRLERIIGDMLSVSEIEAGSLKLRTGDVRLDAIFKELADDLSPQAAAKEIVLKFDLPPKMPVIQGDRDKIVLAVYNLAANAIKYTPAGGLVTIKLAEDAGGVAIEVADNGIGIKPEEADLIFERFYRSKDKRIAGVEGKGLGLTLAREVVRLHGGDITVESRIDKGSTFKIKLPGKVAA